MTTRHRLLLLSLIVAGCGASTPSAIVSPAAQSTGVVPSAAGPSAGGQTSVPSVSPSAITGVITVDPPEVLLDEPTSIRLTGFPPDHEVTIRARTSGAAYPSFTDTGQVRESDATFMTGSDGSVDLASQAPLRGSYDIANAMGLFWSMHEVTAGLRGVRAITERSRDPDPVRAVRLRPDSRG